VDGAQPTSRSLADLTHYGATESLGRGHTQSTPTWVENRSVLPVIDQVLACFNFQLTCCKPKLTPCFKPRHQERRMPACLAAGR